MDKHFGNYGPFRYKIEINEDHTALSTHRYTASATIISRHLTGGRTEQINFEISEQDGATVKEAEAKSLAAIIKWADGQPA